MQINQEINGEGRRARNLVKILISGDFGMRTKFYLKKKKVTGHFRYTIFEEFLKIQKMCFLMIPPNFK